MDGDGMGFVYIWQKTKNEFVNVVVFSAELLCATLCHFIYLLFKTYVLYSKLN